MPLIFPLVMMIIRPLLIVGLAVLALAGPSAAEDPLSVPIEMTEFAFRPALIRITAGRPVRLVFTNRGSIAHQFATEYLRRVPVRLTSGGMYAELDGLELVRIDPGASARVEFLPRRTGRFPFVCAIEGHREAGMTGMLEVRQAP